MLRRHWEGVCLGTGVLVALGGCADLELDPPKSVIHARFDPDAKAIPGASTCRSTTRI